METKKEKLEDFKTAISSTVKSLSNSHKIEVSFGNQTSNSEKNSIKLPDLERSGNKINFEEIRAIADSKSLRLRFSNNKTLKKFEIETKFTSYIKISNKDFKNFLKSNLYNQMETVRRYDYRSALKEGAKLVTSNDISVFIKYYSYMFRKEKSVSSEYLKKIGFYHLVKLFR